MSQYTKDIDIDENGNGTYATAYETPVENSSTTATRTRLGNTIGWEVEMRSYDGDYTSRTDYAQTVTLIDGDTRQYVRRYTNNRNGTYTDILETISNLIGKKIQGTTRCEVIAGMVSRVQKTNREGSSNVYSTTTIAANKTIEDQYWNVVVSTDDAESSEFSALRLVSSDLEAASPIEFTCEFVEGWSDTQQ